MSTKSKAKLKTRDVQEQTGWPYQHTKFIIEQLGYGPVTDEIDRTIASKGNLSELRESLAKRAKEAQRSKAVR